MDIKDKKINILSNLIRQSQNNSQEYLFKQNKSFDDLTKLNKTINYLNQQVCSFFFFFK